MIVFGWRGIGFYKKKINIFKKWKKNVVFVGELKSNLKTNFLVLDFISLLLQSNFFLFK